MNATSALIAVLLAAGSPAPSPGQTTARQVLSRADPPRVSWRFSLNLDVNCDGTLDSIFVAQDVDFFYVAAVLGPMSPSSRFSVVSFRLSGQTQASFCGPFQFLRPEPLSTHSELLEDTGHVPDGYVFSKKCRGLCLAAGECDRFHLYWNHAADLLDWWRV